MKTDFVKYILYGTFLFALLGCDSEQKIERTHDDHELFAPKTTKPEPKLKDSTLKDSIPIPFPPPDSAKENPK